MNPYRLIEIQPENPPMRLSTRQAPEEGQLASTVAETLLV